jgi:hypothetical protein
VSFPSQCFGHIPTATREGTRVCLLILVAADVPLMKSFAFIAARAVPPGWCLGLALAGIGLPAPAAATAAGEPSSGASLVASP